MNLLLGISPRLLSICFNSDIGKVIPSFSVRSAAVVLTIPIYLIVLSREETQSLDLEFWAIRLPLNIKYELKDREIKN
jgi:hypothetical protein